MTTIAYNTKTHKVAFRFKAGATNDDFTAATAGVKNPFVESLENLTIVELASIYNAHSADKPIKKFSDKATAITRVEQILEADEVPIFEAGAKPKAPKAPSVNPDRSAAIAASWQDPRVAKARATRHAVTVGKESFRSTRQAFEALGLPLGQHIPFRIKLKEQGSATFKHEGNNYNFKAYQAES